MIVTPLKTELVEAGKISLNEVLDKALSSLAEGSVLVVTSKIVSLCEDQVVHANEEEKINLVKQEADYYLPKTISQYNYMFTITRKTLISNSGIDESNTGGGFLLWPDNPQAAANQIREYLTKRFGLKKAGVIISDSSVYPMRWGTVVIPIAHSGFLAKTDYRGKPDLFGRPFKVSTSSIAGGLAAAGGVVMGEGTEQTPLAVITEVPFVQFQDRNPTDKELNEFYIPLFEDDLFAPFLQSADWKPGGRKQNSA